MRIAGISRANKVKKNMNKVCSHESYYTQDGGLKEFKGDKIPMTEFKCANPECNIVTKTVAIEYKKLDKSIKVAKPDGFDEARKMYLESVKKGV